MPGFETDWTNISGLRTCLNFIAKFKNLTLWGRERIAQKILEFLLNQFKLQQKNEIFTHICSASYCSMRICAR